MATTTETTAITQGGRELSKEAGGEGESEGRGGLSVASGCAADDDGDRMKREGRGGGEEKGG